MIWTALTLLVCLALVVRLVFFSNEERRQSSVPYRMLIFFLAVYSFSQVLSCLYGTQHASPLSVIFHLTLFIYTVYLKSHHLSGSSRRCRRSSSNS